MIKQQKEREETLEKEKKEVSTMCMYKMYMYM